MQSSYFETKIQSHYWLLRYGPEGFQDIADSVAGIYEKALKRTLRKGILLDAKVYMLITKDEAGWCNVIALANVAEEVSQVAFRNQVEAACAKHEDAFRDCVYEALSEAEFKRKCEDYDNRAKTTCYDIL